LTLSQRNPLRGLVVRARSRSATDLGANGVVKEIHSQEFEDICASATTTKLSLIAGRYVGKDDPSLMIRCLSGLPAVGEALEPFAWPHFVGGWMRGSHCGPLMPCAVEDASRNFRKEERSHARRIAAQNDADFLLIYVDTPEDVARQRLLANRQRPNRVDWGDTSFDEIVRAMEPPGEDETPLVYHYEDDVEGWISEHSAELTR
jgi:hypothetical protein